MRSRTASRLAWSIWVLCMALFLATWALDSMTPPLPIRGGDSSVLDALFAVPRLAFPTIGAFLAARRPENPTGWLFCAMSLVDLTQSFTMAYADHALFGAGGSLPGTEFMAWVSHWIGFPGVFLAAVFLFLLFPTGQLPSRRWRYLPWIAITGSVLSALGDALTPGPLMTHPSVTNAFGIGGLLFGVFPASEAWGIAKAVGAALLGASALGSVAALFLRLRRARGDERQQIKWFAYAAAIMVVSFALTIPLSPWELLNEIAFHMGFVGYLLLPVAAAIAIFRYRLYDIDLIINRTLVYGTLTVTLALIYFGGVAVLQGLLRALTGQESSLAVVASTLAIAALFSPLRRRVQGLIDRRFYRRKYNAAKTLAAFTARLRDETDLDELEPEFLGVVRETVQPSHVSLWLRGPEPGARR